MVCPKCKTQFSDNMAFCPNCGETVSSMINKSGGRTRKEYNTAVYVILTIFLDEFVLGISDFYAGYIKAGLLKFLILAFTGIMVVLTSQALFLLGLGVSLVITISELTALSERTYQLENGQLVQLRPLDIRYDSKGVDNLLKAKYGCGISNIRRY